MCFAKYGAVLLILEELPDEHNQCPSPKSCNFCIVLYIYNWWRWLWVNNNFYFVLFIKQLQKKKKSFVSCLNFESFNSVIMWKRATEKSGLLKMSPFVFFRGLEWFEDDGRFVHFVGWTISLKEQNLWSFVCVCLEFPSVQYIRKDPHFPCHWLLLCFISVAAAAFARFPASGFRLHLPL